MFMCRLVGKSMNGVMIPYESNREVDILDTVDCIVERYTINDLHEKLYEKDGVDIVGVFWLPTGCIFSNAFTDVLFGGRLHISNNKLYLFGMSGEGESFRQIGRQQNFQFKHRDMVVKFVSDTGDEFFRANVNIMIRSMSTRIMWAQKTGDLGYRVVIMLHCMSGINATEVHVLAYLFFDTKFNIYVEKVVLHGDGILQVVYNKQHMVNNSMKVKLSLLGDIE